MAGAGAGPLHWRQRIVSRVIEAGERTDIENARAIVLEGRESGMFAKDVGWPAIGERVLPTLSLIHI